jgi:hypothetical protein
MDFVSDLAEIEADVYVLPPFCTMVADAWGTVDTMNLHRRTRSKPSGLGWSVNDSAVLLTRQLTEIPQM